MSAVYLVDGEEVDLDTARDRICDAHADDLARHIAAALLRERSTPQT